MHLGESTLRLRQFVQKPAGQTRDRVAAREKGPGSRKARAESIIHHLLIHHLTMEMKMSATGSGCKQKRPPSRLQKHAPASLQLEQAAAGAGAAPAVWGDGMAPIPLLSPLVVVSPTVPVWEADQAQAAAARKEGGGDQQLAEARSGAARHGGSGERQAHDVSPRPPAPVVGGAGWRHPALPTPVAEPPSLVPLFQSQCALEVRNAQQ